MTFDARRERAAGMVAGLAGVVTDVTATDAQAASTPDRSVVRVPELVGVPAIEAHDRALDAGLLAVAENATHTAAGRGRVDRQDPDPGAEVRHGGIVRIWISS